MKDTNTPLFKAYYNAISALGLPCFEGEEPDDVKHNLYVVISDPVGNDTSTSNSFDQQKTIQVAVHSWAYKYASTSGLNNAVNDILNNILPSPNSVLSLAAYGMQMMNLTLDQDRTERYGELAGKNYVSRILIFKQDVFICTVEQYPDNI